jgi:hypothetical protein
MAAAMNALFESIIASARNGAARGRAAAGRYSIAAISGALGVIAAMAAVGLGLLALWFLLLPRVGPAGTALILAGVLAALCLILLALAWSALRQDPRKPAAAPAPDVPLLAASQIFNEQKGGLLLAALIAGFGVGARPRRGGR